MCHIAYIAACMQYIYILYSIHSYNLVHIVAAVWRIFEEVDK